MRVKSRYASFGHLLEILLRFVIPREWVHVRVIPNGVKIIE
jgi:hypothetical protein